MSPPCSQTIERVTEKAETDPARAGITSAADPVEGLEHLLPLAPRNSKAFVFDEDHNAIGPEVSIRAAVPPYLMALST